DTATLAHAAHSSMVVGNLNVEHVALGKSKTDAPLIVDPNRVLTGAISPQFFQPVRRGQAQIIPKASRGIQLQQPHPGPLSRGKPGVLPVTKSRSVSASANDRITT